jgi:hypothetical protein
LEKESKSETEVVGDDDEPQTPLEREEREQRKQGQRWPKRRRKQHWVLLLQLLLLGTARRMGVTEELLARTNTTVVGPLLLISDNDVERNWVAAAADA